MYMLYYQHRHLPRLTSKVHMLLVVYVCVLPRYVAKESEKVFLHRIRAVTIHARHINTRALPQLSLTSTTFCLSTRDYAYPFYRRGRASARLGTFIVHQLEE